MAFKEEKIKDGKRIIKQGQVEHKMFIIRTGEVDIKLSDGKNEIVVATLGAGEFFGEISLYNDMPRSASADARGEVTVICLKNLKELQTYLAEDPDFSSRMVQELGRRLANTNQLLIGKMGEQDRVKLTGFMW